LSKQADTITLTRAALCIALHDGLSNADALQKAGDLLHEQRIKSCRKQTTTKGTRPINEK